MSFNLSQILILATMAVTAIGALALALWIKHDVESYGRREDK